MKLVKAAYIVAFAAAGLMVVSALTSSVVFLPAAAIPLMAGIGILRGRVWSAYGYALYQFAGLLAISFLLFQNGVSDLPLLLEAVGGAAINVALAVLFLLAGRSLQAAGSKRGLASPWIAISALCALWPVFVGAFVIPSAAMEDTLLVGDRVLVQRMPKTRPSRGDIVVFLYPLNRRETYVKRVIGVPGDRIRISNKVVYRNGAPLAEPYAVHKTSYVDPYRDNFPGEPNAPLERQAMEMLTRHVVDGEVIVPEKSYFVLGDNRDDSLDSRYWGFVAADDVLGKPLLIYDSQDRLVDLDGNRTGPHRTRWNRILRILRSGCRCRSAFNPAARRRWQALGAAPLFLRRLLPAPFGRGRLARFALRYGRCRLLRPRPLRLRRFALGQPRLGAGALRHVEAENPGEVFASEKLAGGRPLLGDRSRLTRVDDQIRLVHPAQAEEKLGLAIEPRADAIQHRRDMLAHIGPVGATARKLDLIRRGKQALMLPADPLHHALGQASLQQLDQRIDRARAVVANGFPVRLPDGRHFQRDLV